MCIVVVLFGLSGLVDNCLRETVAGSPASVKCMWMDGRGPRNIRFFCLSDKQQSRIEKTTLENQREEIIKIKEKLTR